jgi:hypothetical protein
MCARHTLLFASELRQVVPFHVQELSAAAATASVKRGGGPGGGIHAAKAEGAKLKTLSSRALSLFIYIRVFFPMVFFCKALYASENVSAAPPLRLSHLFFHSSLSFLWRRLIK